MAADPLMADWPGPPDERYFAERRRRMAAVEPEMPTDLPDDPETSEDLPAPTPLRQLPDRARIANLVREQIAAMPKPLRPGERPPRHPDFLMMTYTEEQKLPEAERKWLWERDALYREVESNIITQHFALSGLSTLDWAAIIAQPPDPPAVIRPGVPEVGVTVLAGSPKVGKTLWASQLALESGRSTLMVIEEGSLAGISYRLRHQAAHLGVTDPDVRLALRQRVRVDDPAAMAHLADWVDAAMVDLVILDPLNRLHSGDENRPTEMTRVMDELAELAYGCKVAVLAIHHLAKPSAERRGDIWDRMRGASSIRSGTDANLALEGVGEDRLRLQGELRDGEPISEYLTLDRESLTFHPADAPAAPAKVDPLALRTYVEGRGQVTAHQVAEEFGVTRPTAIKSLRALGCDEFEGVRGRLTFTLGTGK